MFLLGRSKFSASVVPVHFGVKVLIFCSFYFLDFERIILLAAQDRVIRNCELLAIFVDKV